MSAVFPSRTLSVTINCPAADVYAFVSDPENLPQWAAGLCRAVIRSDGDWIAETAQGPVKFKFVETNPFGVLDHYVDVPGGTVHVPMRVVPNGAGSVVLFTLFRPPDMPEAKFREDTGMVERDLATLKTLLEKQAEADSGGERGLGSGRSD